MAEAQMNWQDKYIDKLSRDMDSVKSDMRELRGMEGRIIAHVDNRINHMDAQRALEIREIRADIKAMDGKIDETGKHAQNMTTAIIVGMGAVFIAICSIAVALLVKQ